MQNDEFSAWLSSDNDVTEELIVEAKLPQRRVTLRKRSGTRWSPTSIESEDSFANRVRILERLDEYLREETGNPTKILFAAGAIVVRANSQQARAILGNPQVSAIRMNRAVGRSQH